MTLVDKSVDLLKLIRSEKPSEGAQDDFTGFKVLKVVSSEPDELGLVFEGTAVSLGIELFEIPVSMYPLAVGDRFFVFPIVGNGMRWAVFQKINDGPKLAHVVSNNSVQAVGVNVVYGPDKLVRRFSLGAAGTPVLLQPVWSGGTVKYVVVTIY